MCRCGKSFPRIQRISHCLAISVIISEKNRVAASVGCVGRVACVASVACGCVDPAWPIMRAARQVVKSMKMHKCKRTRLMVNMAMMMLMASYVRYVARTIMAKRAAQQLNSSTATAATGGLWLPFG